MKKTILILFFITYSAFGVEHCQTSSHCTEQNSICKERLDGVGVCMSIHGGVEENTYCEYNSDCSGQSLCKDRGDKITVCMNIRGNIKKGHFCHHNSDCEKRTLCKDRGDGLYACM